jgi:dTDP-glucose 4,6-dehydratase
MYYCSNIQNVDIKVRLSQRYTFIEGNICDADLVTKTLINHKITHVIHFAAQSHVQNSFSSSIQYTKDNVVGTHVLLESCRMYKKIKKFIHVSTDEVYGGDTMTTTIQTEKSILTPTNPYAASKAAAEMIALSYIKSFNLPIIITRGNNVYGKNQHSEKVIPNFINKLRNNERVDIHGDGSCIRDFLHISDAISAFILILDKGVIGEIYNIGCNKTNKGHSILELAQILIKKIKNTTDYAQYINYVEDRPFNDKRYYIDNTKLKTLGWTIKVNFDDGINELIY